MSMHLSLHIFFSWFHSALSMWVDTHDVDEELTGVAHGHAERLAWGCEFGRHRARSRSAAVTTVCGGRPGATHTRLWTLRMVCVLRTLCSLGGAAEHSLGAFSLFSDSLPLPDRPPDSCVPAATFASFLLPLRFEPLLRLPASEMKERKVKEGRLPF